MLRSILPDVYWRWSGSMVQQPVAGGNFGPELSSFTTPGAGKFFLHCRSKLDGSSWPATCRFKKMDLHVGTAPLRPARKQRRKQRTGNTRAA